MAHHKMGLEPTALGLAAGRHHKGDGWSHIREEQEQGSEREKERGKRREKGKGREGERERGHLSLVELHARSAPKHPASWARSRIFALHYVVLSRTDSDLRNQERN